MIGTHWTKGQGEGGGGAEVRFRLGEEEEKILPLTGIES